MTVKPVFIVHGKAVPETGQISIVEMDNPFKRELIWDPVAAGDWTFLGPSEFDSGFRIGKGPRALITVVDFLTLSRFAAL